MSCIRICVNTLPGCQKLGWTFCNAQVIFDSSRRWFPPPLSQELYATHLVQFRQTLLVENPKHAKSRPRSELAGGGFSGSWEGLIIPSSLHSNLYIPAVF